MTKLVHGRGIARVGRRGSGGTSKRHWFGRSALVMVLALILLAFTGPDRDVSPGACRSVVDQRVSSGKARQLICTVETVSGRPAELRLMALELDQSATAAILEGGLPERLREKVGGPASIVKNEIYREVQYLNTKFAESSALLAPEVSYFSPSMMLGGETVVVSDDTDLSNAETARLLALPAINGGLSEITYELAQPKALQSIRTTTQWPAGYEQFHILPPVPANATARERSERALRYGGAIHGTYIWRYLTARDVTDYLANMRVAGTSGEVTGGVTIAGDRDIVPKYVDFVRHVARGALPKDFLFLTGSLEDDSFEFRFYPRHLFLQMVLLENSSDEAVELVQIGFRRERDVNLRPIAATDPGETVHLAKRNDGRWLIPPKQSIAVPLALVLRYGKQVTRLLDKAARGADAPGRIGALKSETLMAYASIGQSTDPAAWTSILETQPLFVKHRDSFKAASLPSVRSYVYGPRLSLQYLETASKRALIRIPNLDKLTMTFTASSGDPQCPYLYVFEESTESYRPLGKILTGARNAGLAREETIEISHVALRFRLAERELERATIDAASLQLTLRDGRSLRLRPNKFPQLERRDGDVVHLDYGHKADFEFALPDDVNERDVVRTRLTVTGYYRRYGALMLAGDAQRND